MNIFKVITGNIVKWWQQTVMPILRIDNNHSGNMRGMGKNQFNDGSTELNHPVMNSPVENEREMVEQLSVSTDEKILSSKESSQKKTDAQLVMERINQEKEKERKQAMEKAQEEARLAAIMSANKVDVNAFIQAGKAAREENGKEEVSHKEESNENSSGNDTEAMSRAEEILARLNREAAEDEAKKVAEIEAARQKAKETFGV